ncbi:hypothetical protein [Rossellomorea aquimaris]|uniref:Uncharacterized protein n=1 Tax=Rossellomorea aquimaris TaxID=189382 RepID=A0A1J6WQJ7_9BACI|nr:hypothetical protein [Rossellomorea aquimaris]OIU70483.1 hypothetical protein BHE18_12290 [Rossellomorea aquimaris]
MRQQRFFIYFVSCPDSPNTFYDVEYHLITPFTIRNEVIVIMHFGCIPYPAQLQRQYTAAICYYRLDLLEKNARELDRSIHQLNRRIHRLEQLAESRHPDYKND